MKTLYLGTDPSEFQSPHEVVHYPVIKIVPREIPLLDLSPFTHIVFTSKHAVRIFYANHKPQPIKVFAIGTVTAKALRSHGVEPDWISEEETQEGMVKGLLLQDLKQARIAIPRSSLSRDVLVNFFIENKIAYHAYVLYDTLPQKLEPVPDLADFNEIVFTSPSTVRAFLAIYGALPQDKILRALGPITHAALTTS
jgi:uroporphyrinogen-III synthase